jgi:ORF6N domain
VETKNLNKAVKRNAERFPADFMFQLTSAELRSLRFRFGTSKARGGLRYRPYAFTEQGVAMLAPPEKPGREIGFHVRERAGRYRVPTRA